jgi:gluconokinase
MQPVGDFPSKTCPAMPKLIIVMGVSGCGKSTVGSKLAEYLGYEFIEADDFHSVAAKQQMANGIPLTDAMREPWLNRLTQHLGQGALVDSVLAYSGLRRRHRQLFREIGFSTLFIHLTAEMDTISQRMSQREGHFMPESMLASQFSSMELPEAEPDMISLDVSADIKHVFETAQAAVALM